MSSYSYSHDGEIFHGEFNSPEAAAAEALHGSDSDNVEVGEIMKRDASFYVIPQTILENANSQAYDECGEVAEDWLNSLSRDKEKMAELQKLIGDWIQANEPPNFWQVINTKEITREELIASGHLDESK